METAITMTHLRFPWRLRLMTSCAVCGRTLTVPRSVHRGIGPVCWSRMRRERQIRLDGTPVMEKDMIRPSPRPWVPVPRPEELPW